MRRNLPLTTLTAALADAIHLLSVEEIAARAEEKLIAETEKKMTVLYDEWEVQWSRGSSAGNVRFLATAPRAISVSSNGPRLPHQQHQCAAGQPAPRPCFRAAPVLHPALEGA